ncbi:MAG TPA: hypothetical protein QGH03_01145 [Candidatus Paceibacterota bacterium]|jgi:hypothetical protein|nr:hypothetical protein [Candidatus Paceibacterota bacterium]HJN62822.1 hypothetical protein [Candidatus Paceibacterota bacterium]
MEILTKNFYRFLFGFIGVIFVSLVLIYLAGVAENNSGEISSESIVRECPEDSTDC